MTPQPQKPNRQALQPGSVSSCVNEFIKEFSELFQDKTMGIQQVRILCIVHQAGEISQSQVVSMMMSQISKSSTSRALQQLGDGMPATDVSAARPGMHLIESYGEGIYNVVKLTPKGRKQLDTLQDILSLHFIRNIVPLEQRQHLSQPGSAASTVVDTHPRAQ